MEFQGLTRITADLCAAFQAPEREMPSFFSLPSIEAQLHCNLDDPTRLQFELAYFWLRRTVPREDIGQYPSVTVISELNRRFAC